MRSSRRPESFLVHRTVPGTYAGAGSASRPLLFDAMQSDQTEDKILFVPESRFQLQVREREVWHLSLYAGLSQAPATNEQVAVGLASLLLGVNVAWANMIASQIGANYFPHVSTTLTLQPGEVITPILWSGSVNGNNPHAVCEFSGIRLA